MIDRRDFLRSAGIIFSSGFLASCAPKVSQKLAALTPEPIIIPTDKPSLVPKVTKEIPTLAKWELSISERSEMLKKPEFFTQLQGKNLTPILTCQFDESQYLLASNDKFHNDNCGEATLATVKKMITYFNKGLVPNFTIGDVYNSLLGKTFKDKRNFTSEFLDWDAEMYFAGIPDAIKLLIPGVEVDVITSGYDFGARFIMVVPKYLWPKLLDRAQSISENGGMIIIGCLMHGGGHIVLATNVKSDGTALIVDPYNGEVKNCFLENLFEKIIDPSAKRLGEQPGLISMVGVISKT